MTFKQQDRLSEAFPQIKRQSREFDQLKESSGND